MFDSIIVMLLFMILSWLDYAMLGYKCLMPLSTLFQLYVHGRVNLNRKP
jgi:hypothetical protein